MKVYDVIKTAEDTYINETSHLSYPGMCWCLKVAAHPLFFSLIV